MTTNLLLYISVFAIIGLFTFLFRAIFLFYVPQFFKNVTIKNGLDSVPSALLVALVIPFTFFVSGNFVPFRIQVLSILLTVSLFIFL